MKAALYARVSTADQTCENQLLELRRYCEARGVVVWREFVDQGISGSRDRRPALDELAAEARRRRFDVVICWRLDRLGRSLRHLVILLEEFREIGIGFISLNEGIDLGTPAGRLQLHVLAALAEFERSRIRERVVAGLARVRASGRSLGRPALVVPVTKLKAVQGRSVRDGCRELGVSRSTLQRWRALARESVSQKPQN